jgi:nicotinamide mononucleotide transporter
MDFFSVEAIFLSIGNYPLSYIEFFGTILYFASVFLISRKNIFTWPIGILSVILYGILFYQIRLYSDMLEQAYYLVISIVGWITWKNNMVKNQPVETAWSSKAGILASILTTIAGTALLSFFTFNFHIWFPEIFYEPASYPIIDALTTVMSFVAMYLTTVRKNEGWLYWIIVDILAIWLYWIKDVRFISIQYIFLLGMALYGFTYWINGRIKNNESPRRKPPRASGFLGIL